MGRKYRQFDVEERCAIAPTDIATLNEDRSAILLAAYNNTPRTCLDWRTPAEAFLALLLRFKRESTFRPSPE